MHNGLLTSMCLAGLLAASLGQGTVAAPIVLNDLSITAYNGSSERVYYYHGQYYPYYYRHGYYVHRVYNHGHWHYY